MAASCGTARAVTRAAGARDSGSGIGVRPLRPIYINPTVSSWRGRGRTTEAGGSLSPHLIPHPSAAGTTSRMRAGR
jgi:hypothetical protein